MGRVLLVALMVLGLAGCSEQHAARALAPSRAGGAQDVGEAAGERDEALISALREAVRREVGVDSIARFVDAPPTVNTRRGADREVLAAADFAPDPDRSDEGPPPARWRTEALDVVYWVRPGEWPNPRIVGVAWFQGGQQELFFAELLPP